MAYTIEDIRALDKTLQAQGETLSANKLVQHLGGSKREALVLLRQYRSETPPARTAAVIDPPPVGGMVIQGYIPLGAPPPPRPIAPAPEEAVVPDVEGLRAVYEAAQEHERDLGIVQAQLKRERDAATQRLSLLQRQRDLREAAFDDAAVVRLDGEIQALQGTVAVLERQRQRIGLQRDEASQQVIKTSEAWRGGADQARRLERRRALAAQ